MIPKPTETDLAHDAEHEHPPPGTYGEYEINTFTWIRRAYWAEKELAFMKQCAEADGRIMLNEAMRRADELVAAREQIASLSKAVCEVDGQLAAENAKLRGVLYKVAQLTLLSKLNVTEEAVALSDEAKLVLLGDKS